MTAVTVVALATAVTVAGPYHRKTFQLGLSVRRFSVREVKDLPQASFSADDDDHVRFS